MLSRLQMLPPPALTMPEHKGELSADEVATLSKALRVRAAQIKKTTGNNLDQYKGKSSINATSVDHSWLIPVRTLDNVWFYSTLNCWPGQWVVIYLFSLGSALLIFVAQYFPELIPEPAGEPGRDPATICKKTGKPRGYHLWAVLGLKKGSPTHSLYRVSSILIQLLYTTLILLSVPTTQ
jgi:hypothetical protein